MTYMKRNLYREGRRDGGEIKKGSPSKACAEDIVEFCQCKLTRASRNKKKEPFKGFMRGKSRS